MSLTDKYKLKICGEDYKILMKHLFPNDGFEAAAIAICGKSEFNNEVIILVHEVILIPYLDCKIRSHNRVTWSTEKLIPFLEKASKKNMSILKIHSHPSGFDEFSEIDDSNDIEFFDGLFGWNENQKYHSSAIFLPNGRILARNITPKLSFVPIERISVSGDDILIWDYKIKNNNKFPEYSKRTLQAFGKGTTNLLNSLSVAVIGCSGTGSPTIEQLVRLGVKKIIIVDPKTLKEHNVNRILNSTISKSKKNIFKTDLIKESIEKIGLGTKVISFSENIYDNNEIIKTISTCDFIFGCTDTYDGRHISNLIASFYLIPYIDMGVDFEPDDMGNIDQITGCIHYIQPKLSSLRTRSVYDDEKLRAAISFRKNPKDYENRRRVGYLAKVGEDSPAVISINMQISSMAINEFLARIHQPTFRYEDNNKFSCSIVDFSDWRIDTMPEGKVDKYLLKYSGRGNITPLLNMPELSENN